MGEGGRKKREKEMERVTKKYLFMVVFANALSKRLSAHSIMNRALIKFEAGNFLVLQESVLIKKSSKFSLSSGPMGCRKHFVPSGILTRINSENEA